MDVYKKYRWQHDGSLWQMMKNNIKAITVIAVLVLAAVVVIGLPLRQSASKQVTLVMNGKSKTVKTHQRTVQGLFNAETIAIGTKDRVSVSTVSALHNGESIRIYRAVPVQIKNVGKEQIVQTSAQTVKAVLREQGIVIGPNDIVTPDLNAPVQADTAIVIRHESKQIVTEQTPIPYKTIRENNTQLVKGKEQVIQSGKNGLALNKIEKIFQDGKLVASRLIGQKVAVQSTNKVVAVGTQNPVSILSARSPDVELAKLDGHMVGVKKVLHNVILTAYAADYKSTGKHPGDPGFAITYTGTHVESGRTVAVDPKVIPLGWWIYIKGYGFRHTEDIGSGVKGKWIDIFVDSSSGADRFGLRRGNTVYLLGPKRPVGVSSSQ